MRDSEEAWIGEGVQKEDLVDLTADAEKFAKRLRGTGKAEEQPLQRCGGEAGREPPEKKAPAPGPERQRQRWFNEKPFAGRPHGVPCLTQGDLPSREHGKDSHEGDSVFLEVF